MKPRFPLSLPAAVAVLLLLAGCSDEPQVARYEQGRYEGKADARPWEGGAFNGDKAAWERALHDRVRSQNEYQRVE
ncbi:hypothetical protein [Aromatoleum aromaticum]|uniref:Lipoprotein n=1 Tax=Aromatoleum aromaticum (strain DSM 19018 / LMG 30748 / EbN1) TaxID=76114 RepID=Q5P4J0_AROAE|nr:hypothetical protein [Aromatoleum aromaticum]NMG53548.1 hypothetical protein [Aromatoleum aromaticum]CAI07773.1 hypothetical protein ebD69 [Aromatoleum aromaticum EbN1]